MDPKFLEELQKLKEQKDADLNKMQDLTNLSIPDFEEPLPVEEETPVQSDPKAAGTIKFEKVTETPAKTPVPGGRRGRKPEEPEKPAKKTPEQKKRAKIRNIILIVAAAVIAVVAVLLTVFFGIKNANMKDYTYQYWGLGIGIENGVHEYSFLGNLETITRYGPIGQVEAVAEFKDGNCLKETAYTPTGEVDHYYTHVYDGNTRIRSSFHRDGQMVTSVTYTMGTDGRIKADYIYYLEENRELTVYLTLSENGNLLTTERADGEGILTEQYTGTLVTESVLSDSNGVLLKIVYEYNDAKQLLTETHYDGNNRIQSRTANQYNEKRLLSKTIYYDGDGNIINYISYNYDQNNNPFKQISYLSDGTIEQKIERVFNDSNRVIKETGTNADGSVAFCRGYEYDGKGYVSKSIVYNLTNNTVVDEYSLYTRSEAGNITQKKTFNASNVLIEKILYNTEGFLSERYQYNGSGSLILEEKRDYDGKQRLTQSTVSTYSDAGKKETQVIEQYNAQGYVSVRITENLKENTYEHFLYEYHQDGWRQKETLFDQQGKTIFEKTYNEKDQVVSENLFENGWEITKNDYVYDENGLVISKTSLDKQTNLTIKTTFTYDADGVLLSSLDENAEGRPVAQKEYNKKGLVDLQTNYDTDGRIKDYYRFEYDKENRVIAQTVSLEDGSVVEKTVYYYRNDGEFHYIVYDGDGKVLEDSRNPSFLPEQDDDSSNKEDEEDLSTDHASDTSSEITDNTEDTPSDITDETDDTTSDITDETDDTTSEFSDEDVVA